VARLLWNAAGTLFLCIGIIGIAIPLLPTTPLLLLAAACYLRGSKRLYDWMMTNRVFGPYLSSYVHGKGVPLRVRIATVTLLWIVIGFSAIVVTDDALVRAVLALVAIGVSLHVLSLRGRTKDPNQR